MRQVFQRARNSSPCVIFFDELDALCPRRSDMAEVCVCMCTVVSIGCLEKMYYNLTGIMWALFS